MTAPSAPTTLSRLKGRRTTTSAYVADRLRAAIQSGTLQDGMELNQVALAQQFGVSRVPVREALSALEAEGWVKSRAHYRAVVHALSPDRVAQIFEVRTLLEAHLIGRAARNIDAARLQDLRAMCDAMDRIRNHDKWVQINRKFHRALLESAKAEAILDLVEQMTAQVERYLRLRGAGPMREGQAGAEHRAILAAVSRGDVRQARSLIRSHINRTRDLVLSAIRESLKSRQPAASPRKTMEGRK